MEWRPSPDERKNHPVAQELKAHYLPADACVRGRLVVSLVRPDNGADAFLLVLFTTLTATEASLEELLKLYGNAWCKS